MSIITLRESDAIELWNRYGSEKVESLKEFKLSYELNVVAEGCCEMCVSEYAEITVRLSTELGSVVVTLEDLGMIRSY